LQLDPDSVPRANAILAGLPGVRECVILSTCNRIEFYLVTVPGRDAFDIVGTFYRRFKGLDVTGDAESFRTRNARGAAGHLFRVAAGIDSMVLGENQILGQVKDAYSAACAVKSAGKVIHRLFHHAFRIGKQVRTDTEIGRGACSVGTAALEMLAGRLGALRRPTVLLIGINKMIRIAATRLRQSGDCRLVFANRTAAKACAFAAGFGAEGHGLESLADLIAPADVVISCTSAPHPIVTREVLHAVRARDPGKRRVFMDLAVPRDVEVPEGEGARNEVFDLDDVREFVKDRQREREMEVPHAEKLIRHRLGEFLGWYDQVMEETEFLGGQGNAALREERSVGTRRASLPSRVAG
jgi:glutamyl-tRNA reductase